MQILRRLERPIHANRLRLGRAGVVSLEFAIVAPILIALLGGATDLGMAIERSIRLTSAARAGAFYAALAPNDTSNAASAFVTSLLSDLSGLNVSVTLACQCPASTSATTGPAVNCGTTCAAGLAKYVTVVARAPFTSLFPLSASLPFETIGATTGRAVARIL
jgi:Flp pilus assembly protein TadG